jgi:hypothetical protein
MFRNIHRVSIPARDVQRLRSECTPTGDSYPFSGEDFKRYSLTGVRASDLVIHLPDDDVPSVAHVAFWLSGDAAKECLNVFPVLNYENVPPPPGVLRVGRQSDKVTLRLVSGNDVDWQRIYVAAAFLRPGGLEKVIAYIRSRHYAFLSDDDVADVLEAFPARYADARTEAEANRAASNELDAKAFSLGWRRDGLKWVNVKTEKDSRNSG